MDQNSKLVKAPISIRIMEIVVGAITLILAGLIMAYPAFATMLILVLLSMSLLFAGIEGIIVGALGRRLSKGQRTLRVVAGIVAVGLSIATFAFPSVALLSLVVLLSIGLFFLGGSGIVKGILESGMSMWVRTLYVGVGVLTIGLSAAAIAAPGLALLTLYTLLAITLVINGAAYIATGIAGVVYVPMESSSILGSESEKKKWQSDAA
jgi:uncharacterized membrane protein HdeD (DUF308 family)